MSSVLPYPEHILVYLVHALVHHPSFPNMNDCKEIHAFDHIYRYVFSSLKPFFFLSFNFF